MVMDDIALAVGQLGELVVVAKGVHEERPVHEVEIDVVQPEALERLFEPQLAARRVGGPDLGHDEDILALDDARVEGFFETCADFVFVAVAVGCVD